GRRRGVGGGPQSCEDEDRAREERGDPRGRPRDVRHGSTPCRGGRLGRREVTPHDRNGRPRLRACHVTRRAATKHRKVASRYDFRDRKSTRLNSSHVAISYAVFCLKKKNKNQ